MNSAGVSAHLRVFVEPSRAWALANRLFLCAPLNPALGEANLPSGSDCRLPSAKVATG